MSIDIFSALVLSNLNKSNCSFLFKSYFLSFSFLLFLALFFLIEMRTITTTIATNAPQIRRVHSHSTVFCRAAGHMRDSELSGALRPREGPGTAATARGSPGCSPLLVCCVWFCRVAACRILVSLREIEPGALAVKLPSPNHWTARELLYFL